MVDLVFLARRRRKRIAAIVSLISAVGISTLSIIAFLGNHVGTFTVSLRTSNEARISLSERSDMSNPTTYLRVGQLEQFETFTAEAFVDEAKIDSQETDYLYGAEKDEDGKIIFMNFLKYTFYVKNTGDVPVNYTFSLDITENKKPTNVAYDLSAIVRIRLYENVFTGTTETHSSTTYARSSKTPHIDPVSGEVSYKERVSTEAMVPVLGYAEEFPSETNCITRRVNHMPKNQIIRYTALIWLEGEDPECINDPPQNGFLKFGASLNGYGTVEEK